MHKSLKREVVIPVLFMALIFFLSVIPINNCEIKQRFGFLLPLKSNIQKSLHINLDLDQIQNFLHPPFFVLLAFLWMRLFMSRKVAFKKAVTYTLLITFVFSTLDEFSQVFAPTRDASYMDLLLDLIGCVVGVTIYKLLNKV